MSYIPAKSPLGGSLTESPFGQLGGKKAAKKKPAAKGKGKSKGKSKTLGKKGMHKPLGLK